MNNTNANIADSAEKKEKKKSFYQKHKTLTGYITKLAVIIPNIWLIISSCFNWGFKEGVTSIKEEIIKQDSIINVLKWKNDSLKMELQWQGEKYYYKSQIKDLEAKVKSRTRRNAGLNNKF